MFKLKENKTIWSLYSFVSLILKLSFFDVQGRVLKVKFWYTTINIQFIPSQALTDQSNLFKWEKINCANFAYDLRTKAYFGDF